MILVRTLLLLLACALLPGGGAQAQTYPQPTGYVVDAAGVLPADQAAALTQRLAALDSATGTQIAVVTVPSLEGREIEEYGIGLLRAWGVGQEGRDNGAILLVAPSERRVRIEVGYGLEPILTDALSFRIVNRTILPRFREGDMAGGIVAGADALIGHLSASPEEQQAATQAAEAERTGSRRGGGFNVTALIFWGAILFVVVLPMIARAAGGGGRKGPWGRRGSRRRRGDGMGIALWTLANIAANVAASSGRGGGGGFGGGGGGGGFGGFGGGSGGGGGASGSW